MRYQTFIFLLALGYDNINLENFEVIVKLELIRHIGVLKISNIAKIQ